MGKGDPYILKTMDAGGKLLTMSTIVKHLILKHLFPFTDNNNLRSKMFAIMSCKLRITDCLLMPL